MQKYLVSSTPHIKKSMNVQIQNLFILLSLLPCVVCSVIYYHFTALLILSVSVLSSFIFDIGFSYIILGSYSFKDISSIISGVLLGLLMPVQVPIYFVVIAAFIAVVISKVMFGGEGKELINGPALGVTVLAALVVGFTTSLCSYTNSAGILISSPLELFAENNHTAVPLLDLFLGSGGGLIGTTCIVACLVGGILLCVTGVYDFYIPVLSIITFVIFSLISKGTTAFLPELFSGSFIFVCFFMLPAHTSSPNLWISKAVYSILFGILVGITRQFYLFGEAGVLFCLLLCNFIAPFLDTIFSLLFMGRRSKKYE